MADEKFVELVRYSSISREPGLFIAATGELVGPINIFKPRILRCNPDTPKELKRELIGRMIFDGANAYEVGDARTVGGEKELCERDYAIGIYTIPADSLERALKELTRLEKELSPGRF